MEVLLIKHTWAFFPGEKDNLSYEASATKVPEIIKRNIKSDGNNLFRVPSRTEADYHRRFWMCCRFWRIIVCTLVSYMGWKLVRLSKLCADFHQRGASEICKSSICYCVSIELLRRVTCPLKNTNWYSQFCWRVYRSSTKGLLH